MEGKKSSVTVHMSEIPTMNKFQGIIPVEEG